MNYKAFATKFLQIVLIATPTLPLTFIESAKAAEGEQSIGNINNGDADQHCKYWHGSAARVTVFDTSTSVFVCSKNGHSSVNGGFSLGVDTSVNGGSSYDEEASEVNVAFDDLCVGKFQYNSYSKVANMSNIRYDYWAGSCVGTPTESSSWW
jgi:uncharacterized protein YneR